MKVVLLGSGNVATHLGRALKQSGHTILQVWSRDGENARVLAERLDAKPVAEIEQLSEFADIYIISVKDDAIDEVAAAIPFTDKLIVHTAGSVEISILKNFTSNFGVLYPLQTFSKGQEISLVNVPIILEGSSPAVENTLREVAGSISREVYFYSSEQRRILHLAAVFACNFTNHLYTISDNLLQRHNLNFGLLRPLILETANKVQNNFPEDVQTGPAVRNDKRVMDKHLRLLTDSPELLEIYRLLSQSIVNLHQIP